MTDVLPAGSLVRAYRVESVLGKNGFTITYKATLDGPGTPAVVQEYFPADWSNRAADAITVSASAAGKKPARTDCGKNAFDWGRGCFLREAEALAAVDHDAVINVRDCFLANGTAYSVADFEPGEPFSALCERKKGAWEESELRRWLIQMLDGLEAVHRQGVLHGNLTPDSVIVRARDGRLLLLDFAAARQAAGGGVRALAGALTPYAAVEQYRVDGVNLGPWTDVYAVAAIAYRCISGTPPEAAPRRAFSDPLAPAREVGAGRFSQPFLRLIDDALAPNFKDRTRSTAVMKKALLSSESAAKRGDGAAGDLGRGWFYGVVLIVLLLVLKECARAIS